MVPDFLLDACGTLLKHCQSLPKVVTFASSQPYLLTTSPMASPYPGNGDSAKFRTSRWTTTLKRRLEHLQDKVNL